MSPLVSRYITVLFYFFSSLSFLCSFYLYFLGSLHGDSFMRKLIWRWWNSDILKENCSFMRSFRFIILLKYTKWIGVILLLYKKEMKSFLKAHFYAKNSTWIWRWTVTTYIVEDLLRCLDSSTELQQGKHKRIENSWWILPGKYLNKIKRSRCKLKKEIQQYFLERSFLSRVGSLAC